MKRLQCEMCGSTNMLKQDGVFVCESCGTRYSVEEAKKMMAEDTVDENAKADDDTSDDLDELYEKARNAKDSCDYELAYRLYKKILPLDPNGWDCNFYVDSCKVESSTIEQIIDWDYIESLLSHLADVIIMVDNGVADDEKYDVLNIINLECTCLSLSISNKALKFATEHYDEHSDDVMLEVLKSSALVGSSINFVLGAAIENRFNDKFSTITVDAWKRGIEYLQKASKPIMIKAENLDILNEWQKHVNEYGEKIRKYDTSYVIPSLPNIASSDPDDDDDSEESYESDYDDGGDESDSYVSDCYDGSNPDGSCGLNSYDNGGSEEHPVSEGVQMFLLFVGVFFGPVFLFMTLFFIVPKGDAEDIFYSFVVSAIGFAALRKFYKNNKRGI